MTATTNATVAADEGVNLQIADGRADLASQAARIRAQDPTRYDLLTFALQAAVPLRMHDIRAWVAEQRARHVNWTRTLDLIASSGDVLLHGGRRGEAAAVFARLVDALAVLAHVEGGVTVFGLHWCAEPHLECPSRPQLTAARGEVA